MKQLSEADRYLLEQIRAGQAEGWSQLVDRYQGRLVAFARKQIGAEAEDLVQETFLSFLKGLASYRGQASLETYLFTILRRKVIDQYRGRKVSVCSLQESFGDDADGPRLSDRLASPDALAASWYVRRDEANDRLRDVLATALRDLVQRYRQTGNFRNLQLAELVFYAQLKNKAIAELIDINVQQVALLKHRFLNRLAARVAELLGEEAVGEDASFEQLDLLTEAWEQLRPSCPKRSTIGQYVLGTLDDDWRDYVAFHIDQLGCRFCRANLDDLVAEQHAADAEAVAMRQRIMESTVGFLKSVGA